MLQGTERTCISCRLKTSKDNLLRLVVVDDRLTFDSVKKLQGRGYYICPNISCINKCFDVTNKREMKQLINLKKIIKTKIEITTGQLRELHGLLIAEVTD